MPRSEYPRPQFRRENWLCLNGEWDFSIGAAKLYSREYAHRIYAEWMEAVERDYNHPCIVAWVPLNESWGVPEIKGDSRVIATPS